MGRIRSIKSDFFNDEEIAELPMVTRLGFIGLWCNADREGRLEDRPKRLSALIFPHDNVDLVGILDALAAAGFIIRYQVSGKSYIQIRTFHKHQRPNNREKPSEIPPISNSLNLDQGSLYPNQGSLAGEGGGGMENGNGIPYGEDGASLLGEELQHARDELAKTKALVAELRTAAATTTALATVAQVQAAAVVSESEDIVRDLFDLGVKIMTKTGTKEDQARTIVGKLRKEHGESEAMRLLVEAESKTFPQSWLAATFVKKAYSPC